MANANVNTLQLGSSMTIKELRKFIPIVGKELTVIIQSEPGCGKTSLLSMMAEDNGDEWRKPGDVCPDDKWDYIYVEVEDQAGRRAWTNSLFVTEDESHTSRYHDASG